MKSSNSLDHQTFSRLSKIYIIALGAIGLFTFIAQFYIQGYLSDQIDDSSIINIAGKQRMLSQKISKNVLILSQFKEHTSYQKYIKDLKETLDLWKQSHHVLKQHNLSIDHNQNATEIAMMFKRIEPYFQSIYKHGDEISQLVYHTDAPLDKLAPHVSEIIKNEPLYLAQMDAIVLRYEKEAQQKVSSLKKIEYLLSGIIVLILILEFFLLFRPAAFKIKKTISKLLFAQKKAENMASKAENLRNLQEKNVQELISLTKAVNQTLLYARVDRDGNIQSLGELFAKVLEVEPDIQNKNIADVMGLSDLQKNRLLQLITQSKGGVFHEEFEFFKTNDQKIWLDVSIQTVFRDLGNSERLILCSDISKRKEAQEEVEKLQASRYKEKEKLQKSNAGQIVEAQEEERKRIAKEIHDSIGQMLTALKLNIESINLNNPDKASLRIEGLKKLSQDLIQGVRIATFNLTPPELKDYGIPIALQKMARELSKLTGKKIIYENQSNFDKRFDTLIETNLYRVVQEAVNNAIKYAETDSILITIKHSKEIFSIKIDDNGKGFDINKIPSKPSNNAEGGMGLFFMKERINYINGRIFINSTPGEGTRITLNYPIKNS